MFDIVSIGVFSIVCLIITILVIKLIKADIQLRGLKVQIIKNLQEIQALKVQLDHRDVKDIEKTDGFLKFLAESRAWAYTYIEDVQVVLKKFIDDVEPRIKHFNAYGDTIDTPLSPAMREISKSFVELKSLLPEDYGRID